jgi:Xaa-Pro aminopeptidase
VPPSHALRRERLQAAVAALGADAALVTSLVNVRYLTGLASSNAAFLLPADGPGVLATDARYALAADRDCPDVELVVGRMTELALIGRASGCGLGRVAFESHEVTVERHEALTASAPGVEFIPLGRAVEELRVVKDPGEIALLARACAITTAAFEEVVPRIRPGMTERALAAALERAMSDRGAERPAFDTIVASGPNGAIPHHVPGSRELSAGDLVTIDFGARYGGYHADMTRTVALGEPAAWQREIYALVAAAQQAGMQAATPGTDVSAVDGAARGLIEEAGHGDHFTHGLGHGVGLEIHEAPIMGHGKTGRLRDRVAITVEPGIYLPGMGGVRIEDTLVVRAGAGTAVPQELLTTTTRELLAL